MEWGAVMRGRAPCDFLGIQPPPPAPLSSLHRPDPPASLPPTAAAVKSCPADNAFARLGNGLLPAFEALCFQLQEATSGKQRSASTGVAVEIAVNCH